MAAEEKVAPCIPSRPVRPPMATMRSRGSTFLRTALTGMSPTVPTKTSGLKRKASSNQRAPAAVGMPMRLP